MSNGANKVGGFYFRFNWIFDSFTHFIHLGSSVRKKFQQSFEAPVFSSVVSSHVVANPLLKVNPLLSREDWKNLGWSAFAIISMRLIITLIMIANYLQTCLKSQQVYITTVLDCLTLM
jgi:hypothetical protein